MRILVTGGCGFIGTNLIPLLLTAGHSVRVLDNLTVGKKENIERYPIDLQVGDIRDKEATGRATRGMEAVVHLAAQTSVVNSQQEPEFDFEVNAKGTLNVLSACRDQGIKHFIFASSNAPIGEATPPIDETKAPHPMSPYGASKLCGEGYCSAFYHSFGLKTLVLRFANVYGPLSSHKGSVVAKFIKDILTRGQVVIYGDGAQTRDFIYVDDLCNAILHGIDFPKGGETFQIATGYETSVLELVDFLKEFLGEFVVDHEKQRDGEIIKNYSQVSKAKELLGWTPKVALNDGIKRTIDWFVSSNLYIREKP